MAHGEWTVDDTDSKPEMNVRKDEDEPTLERSCYLWTLETKSKKIRRDTDRRSEKK